MAIAAAIFDPRKQQTRFRGRVESSAALLPWISCISRIVRNREQLHRRLKSYPTKQSRFLFPFSSRSERKRQIIDRFRDMRIFLSSFFFDYILSRILYRYSIPPFSPCNYSRFVNPSLQLSIETQIWITARRSFIIFLI